MVGNYLQTAPELVQRMVDEGHLVGNHTEHHWDMSRIADRETFRKELETVEEQYRELTGQEMEKFYRDKATQSRRRGRGHRRRRSENT